MIAVRLSWGLWPMLAWVCSIGLALMLPWWCSANPVDAVTRWTARAALVWYVLSLVALLSQRSARLLWTLAWAAYVIHVLAAFHWYHRWSHTQAMEHVRAASGAGEGIFVSHVFGLLWTLDVLWWWTWNATRARRAAWLSYCLHGFLLFVAFNATVIYETGPTRWLGLLTTLGLLILWWRRDACFLLEGRGKTGGN